MLYISYAWKEKGEWQYADTVTAQNFDQWLTTAKTEYPNANYVVMYVTVLGKEASEKLYGVIG